MLWSRYWGVCRETLTREGAVACAPRNRTDDCELQPVKSSCDLGYQRLPRPHWWTDSKDRKTTCRSNAGKHASPPSTQTRHWKNYQQGGWRKQTASGGNRDSPNRQTRGKPSEKAHDKRRALEPAMVRSRQPTIRTHLLAHACDQVSATHHGGAQGQELWNTSPPGVAPGECTDCNPSNF